MTESNRSVHLDALRGVAILAVMSGHSFSELHRGKTAGIPVLGGSWSGVDLFFVLSGFFIGGQIFRELRDTGTLQLKRFWIRRGFRIWPAYVAAYGYFTLVPLQSALRHHEMTPVAADALTRIPYNLLFVQNYLGHGWPSSWSLAVEEHFYIGFPLLLLAWAWFRRIRSQRGPAELTTATFVVCAILALEVAIRAIEIIVLGARAKLYGPTHVRVDGLAVGVWLAWVFCYFPQLAIRARYFSSVLVGSLVLAAVWFASAIGTDMPLDQLNSLRYTALAIAYGVWVSVCAARAELGVRPSGLSNALAIVGRYSYCLYLSQAVIRDTPMYYVVVSRLEARIGPIAGVVLFFATSSAAAVILSRGVERPMLRLRDRIIPREPVMVAPTPTVASA